MRNEAHRRQPLRWKRPFASKRLRIARQPYCELAVFAHFTVHSNAAAIVPHANLHSPAEVAGRDLQRRREIRDSPTPRTFADRIEAVAEQI